MSSAGGGNGLRNALRIGGTLCVLLGLAFVGFGLVDFFGNGFPQHFWVFFVGLPLLGVGGWLLQAGFLGAITGFVARESAPAVNHFMGAVRAGTATPPPPPSAAAQYCSQCGRAAAVDARFCAGCGRSLA